MSSQQIQALITTVITVLESILGMLHAQATATIPPKLPADPANEALRAKIKAALDALK